MADTDREPGEREIARAPVLSAREPSNALKGWLSEIYFPSLLDAGSDAADALAQRLGERSTVDAPIIGRATGLDAIRPALQSAAAWLAQRAASYTRHATITGVDRDVTEGELTLAIDGRSVALPVAVVAERRKSREVELRVYFATQPITGKATLRAPLVAPSSELVLPQIVADHAAAIEKGDAMAALACFEADGTLRDARGVAHAKSADLKEHYEDVLGGAISGGGIALQRGATADDGRTCAIEYTLTKIRGRDVPPQAGLMVYERGDSGLLRALRIYDDLLES